MSQLILVPTAFEHDLLFGKQAVMHPSESGWIVSQVGSLTVALCGIGPAAAAMSTYALAGRYQPERITLAGIAGAFAESGHKPGDLVQVSQDTFADLGYHDETGVFNLDDMKLPHLPRKEGPMGCRFSLAAPFDLPRATALTVSTITSDDDRATALWGRFRADLENMEGAAVAMAAETLGIPVCQIRAVSNRVGPRDPKSWLIKEPLARLGAFLLENVA